MSEQHIFSTGTLTAKWTGQTSSVIGPLTSLTAAYHSGPSGHVGPASNAVDGSLSTGSDMSAGASTAYPNPYDWLIVDMGSAFYVTQVVVKSAGITGLNSGATMPLFCWGTLNGSLNPSATGTTRIGADQNITNPSLTDITFAQSSGDAVYAQYLLIGCINGTGGTLGFAFAEVEITIADNYLPPAGIPFAVVQNAEMEWKWASKDLFGPAAVSDFPLDVGFSEAMWTVKVGNAGIRADSLQQVVASQLSGTTTLTNELPQTIAMPAFAASLATTDTLGNPVTFTMNNCRAKGVTLPFKLNDFVVEEFELMALEDENGVVGTVVFG